MLSGLKDFSWSKHLSDFKEDYLSKHLSDFKEDYLSKHLTDLKDEYWSNLDVFSPCYEEEGEAEGDEDFC